MQIADLKELKKLLQLCRAQGVTEINLGEVSFKLGDLPYEPDGSKSITDETPAKYENFPTGNLTPEQLMFYSSGGSPEDDPFRQDT